MDLSRIGEIVDREIVDKEMGEGAPAGNPNGIFAGLVVSAHKAIDEANEGKGELIKKLVHENYTPGNLAAFNISDVGACFTEDCVTEMVAEGEKADAQLRIVRALVYEPLFIYGSSADLEWVCWFVEQTLGARKGVMASFANMIADLNASIEHLLGGDHDLSAAPTTPEKKLAFFFINMQTLMVRTLSKMIVRHVTSAICCKTMTILMDNYRKSGEEPILRVHAAEKKQRIMEDHLNFMASPEGQKLISEKVMGVLSQEFDSLCLANPTKTTHEDHDVNDFLAQHVGSTSLPLPKFCALPDDFEKCVADHTKGMLHEQFTFEEFDAKVFVILKKVLDWLKDNIQILSKYYEQYRDECRTYVSKKNAMLCSIVSSHNAETFQEICELQCMYFYYAKVIHGLNPK